MTNEPELAILDADIILYRAACAADSKGWSFKELEERIAFDVAQWTPTACTRHICAITGKKNFRYDVYDKYKANRKGKPRPVNLATSSQIMRDNHPCVVRDNLEADDLMGLGMTSGLAYGVSLDKDMLSCHGWYWNPDKMCFPVVISEEDADKNFYKQWLMGDSTDNIPGAMKVGPVKANKIVEDNYGPNIIPVILKEFEDRGHDYEHAVTMARLVRILRDGEYNKETGEVTLWEPLETE